MNSLRASRVSKVFNAANLNQMFESTFRLPNSGLMAYFGRVKRGNNRELRTPFASKRPLEKVINEWQSIYNTLDLSGIFTSLNEFEMKMKGKVGPLSIMKPLRERIDDIQNYYNDIKISSIPIDSRAIERVCGYLKPIANCKPMSYRNVINDMKLSTNSGSPFFEKKRNVVDQSIPNQLIDDGEYQYVLLDKWWLLGSVLGWRGQEGGIDLDDVKQRVIWMMPFSVNISELSVYKPLIRAGQSGLFPVWISNDAVDRRVTALFDTKAKDDYVICTDFKRFDQHFNRNLSNVSKQILNFMFKDRISDWMQNTFNIKYNIPMWANKDLVFTGEHGMASGSGGTNVDETLAHMSLQHESAVLNSTELNPYSQCLGDDGILSYRRIDIDKVIDNYTSHGLVMEPTKQDVAKDSAIFLRRWHHTRYRKSNICVGVYSTFRALGRLCEQERFYDPSLWSKEAECLRYLSILENVKWHPYREKFADFVMERDKYSLGLGIPGFFDKLQSYAQNLVDQLPNFIGYNQSEMSGEGVSGINEWWIVRYVKSKLRSR